MQKNNKWLYTKERRAFSKMSDKNRASFYACSNMLETIYLSKIAWLLNNTYLFDQSDYEDDCLILGLDKHYEQLFKDCSDGKFIDCFFEGYNISDLIYSCDSCLANTYLPDEEKEKFNILRRKIIKLDEVGAIKLNTNCIYSLFPRSASAKIKNKRFEMDEFIKIYEATLEKHEKALEEREGFPKILK